MGMSASSPESLVGKGGGAVELRNAERGEARHREATNET